MICAVPGKENSMANNINAKAERFVRVAEKRVNKIIDQFRTLGKCSIQTVYSYRKDQVEQIFNCLQEELNETKKKFTHAMVGKPAKFSLSSERETVGSEVKYPSVSLLLPDGSKLVAAAIDDPNFPAINIYLVRPNGDEKELVAFAEYNSEHSDGARLCIGTYQSDSDETKAYMPYDAAERNDDE